MFLFSNVLSTSFCGYLTYNTMLCSFYDVNDYTFCCISVLHEIAAITAIRVFCHLLLHVQQLRLLSIMRILL